MFTLPGPGVEGNQELNPEAGAVRTSHIDGPEKQTGVCTPAGLRSPWLSPLGWRSEL
jgi:hypothetical protein